MTPWCRSTFHVEVREPPCHGRGGYCATRILAEKGTSSRHYKAVHASWRRATMQTNSCYFTCSIYYLNASPAAMSRYREISGERFLLSRRYRARFSAPFLSRELFAKWLARRTREIDRETRAIIPPSFPFFGNRNLQADVNELLSFYDFLYTSTRKRHGPIVLQGFSNFSAARRVLSSLKRESTRELCITSL